MVLQLLREEGGAIRPCLDPAPGDLVEGVEGNLVHCCMNNNRLQRKSVILYSFMQTLFSVVVISFLLFNFVLCKWL